MGCRNRVLALALVATVASTAAAGCFASHEAGDGRGGELEHDERFVGDWQVSAAEGWARVPTSTVYRLQPDGSIEVPYHREGSYFEGEAGRWRATDAGVTCRFADRWWSEGSTTLFVASDCDDGTRAIARLEFPHAEARNTVDPQPMLAEPAGAEPLWEGPQGSLFRCTEAPEDCPPF